MSWKTFIDKQAQELETDPQILRRFMTNLLEEVQRRLLNKSSVVLRGIVTMSVTKRRATNKVNPQTGLVEQLPSRYRVTFKPSRELNKQLDERYRE